MIENEIHEIDYEEEAEPSSGVSFATVVAFAIFAALSSYTYIEVYRMGQDAAFKHRLAAECEQAGGFLAQIEGERLQCQHYISPERQIEGQLRLQGKK